VFGEQISGVFAKKRGGTARDGLAVLVPVWDEGFLFKTLITITEFPTENPGY
jgi:hypothetical protein